MSVGQVLLCRVNNAAWQGSGGKKQEDFKMKRRCYI